MRRKSANMRQLLDRRDPVLKSQHTPIKPSHPQTPNQRDGGVIRATFPGPGITFTSPHECIAF
jgi:hypothetical protein